VDDDLMPIERSWARALPDCGLGECLDAEALLELAESGRRGRDFSGRMAHVAACRECRQTLRLLTGNESTRADALARPKLFWPWKQTIFATAAAAAAVALFFAMRPSDSAVPIRGGSQPVVRQEPPPIQLPETAPETRSGVGDRNRGKLVARKSTSQRRPRRSEPAQLERPPVVPPDVQKVNVGDGGVLEGEVVVAMVLEGEVRGGPYVEGEVLNLPTVQGQVVPPPDRLSH
jgi:hypothetical protein